MHLSLVSSIKKDCSIEEQIIYGKQCVSLIKKYELSFLKTTTPNHYCSFFLDFIGLEVDGFFFLQKNCNHRGHKGNDASSFKWGVVKNWKDNSQ